MLFKSVLTVPCSKFNNEKTRIILFSLFWFPECWFGLVTSTYKLFSLTVFRTSNALVFSEEMLVSRHLTLSWFPFLLSVSEFLVAGFVAETFQICLRKFVFCLSFERYHATQVCQGWILSLVLCLLKYLQYSTYCQIVSP